MSKRWVGGAIALFSVLVFLAPVIPARATSGLCRWQCTNATNSGEAGTLDNCFEGGCRTACDNACLFGDRGGCRTWTCDDRTSDPQSGDLCPSAILLNTPVGSARDAVAEDIRTKILSSNFVSGQWVCRTETDLTKCVASPSGSYHCPGSQQCCIPAAPTDCLTTYLNNGGSAARVEALRASSNNASPSDEWFCQATANADERRFRCIGDSATQVCPGRANNYRCCVPPDAPAGYGCSAGADATAISRLETNSGTTRDQWYCQQVDRTNRTNFCVTGSSLCGSTYQCCIPPTAQAATVARAQGSAAPAAYCAQRAVQSGGTTDSVLAGKVQSLCNGAANCPTYASSTWTCVRACQASPTRDARCVPGGCTQADGGGDDASGVFCCAQQSGFLPATAQNACTAGGPPAGGPGGPSGGAGAGGTGAGGGSTGGIVGRIVLPSCISNGRCSLDDILRTGASFANYLLELSGALFLLIFVYAGFRYLLAMGNDTVVKSAKGMLRNAAIGMIIVIAASTIVRYVYATFTAPEQALTSLCYSRFGNQGFDCRYIPGATDQEISANVSALGCKSETGLCNLQAQDKNFRCCPFTNDANAGTGASGQ